MNSSTFLDVVADDAQALLVAAESDWTRPVPHCPQWDAADLTGHLGGIFAWMATIVTTGQRVPRANREVPPTDHDALRTWYLGHLRRTIEVLSRRDPETRAWTFSSRGVSTVRWWRRRLAVETAIHRWDAEHAIELDAATTRALDGEVATAGIEEFLDEFLPGLVAQPTVVGLSSILELEATDGERRWRIDLDELRGGGLGPPASDSATVRASRSDLLLWLTNREPTPSFAIDGGSGIGAWQQLRR